MYISTNFTPFEGALYDAQSLFNLAMKFISKF